MTRWASDIFQKNIPDKYVAQLSSLSGISLAYFAVLGYCLEYDSKTRDTEYSEGEDNIVSERQNRSTEGCSNLKRSVDMTKSGKNGLNIRTNASPKLST